MPCRYSISSNTKAIKMQMWPIKSVLYASFALVIRALMVNTSPQSSGFYSAVVAMYIAHLIKFSANGKLHSISIIIVFQFSTHTHTHSENNHLPLSSARSQNGRIVFIWAFNASSPLTFLSIYMRYSSENSICARIFLQLWWKIITFFALIYVLQLIIHNDVERNTVRNAVVQFHFANCNHYRKTKDKPSFKSSGTTKSK